MRKSSQLTILSFVNDTTSSQRKNRLGKGITADIYTMTLSDEDSERALKQLSLPSQWSRFGRQAALLQRGGLLHTSFSKLAVNKLLRHLAGLLSQITFGFAIFVH